MLVGYVEVCFWAGQGLALIQVGVILLEQFWPLEQFEATFAELVLVLQQELK